MYGLKSVEGIGIFRCFEKWSGTGYREEKRLIQQLYDLIFYAISMKKEILVMKNRSIKALIFLLLCIIMIIACGEKILRK